MANKKKPLPVDKKIEKLIQIYKEAEQRLVKTIAEKEIKGNVTTFYNEMLKQVQQEILRLQIYNTQWATDITKQLYEQAFKEATEMLGVSDNLTQLHKDAVEVLVDNIVNNLNEATNLVGRRVEDSIRDIGLKDAAMKFATGQTIRQLQQELVNDLVNNNTTCMKDKLGRNIPISSYAETVARSIVAETQNTSVKNVMKENSHDLVKMTQHSTACPVCVPYEGRVYSLSGKDERFPSIKKIPGFASGYNNIHPRCRHRIMPWIEKYNDVEKEIKNSNKPFEIPKEKEASVRAYQEHQKEKARLRNDKKQYERFKTVLGDLSPKSFAQFKKIKYNDSEKWNDLKENFKIVDSYKVDFGLVDARKILELDKLAFNSKKTRFDYTKFTGKDRKDIKNLGRSGNFAVMEFEGKLYFSHSSVNYKEEPFFESITGNKSDFILHKDDREFETLVINNIERHYCTEAKMFEFLNDNIENNYSKEITILSELDMCDSCRMVLNEQFLKKYPNIKVNVISGKYGVNWRKRK